MSPHAQRTSGWTSLASAAALITAVTLASRMVGFGRWLAQAQFVGTGGIDAPYNSANILPNLLFEVAAGGALAGAVVPLVSGPLSRAASGLQSSIQAKAQASLSASALLTWTMAILLPLGGLTAVFAQPIASALDLGDPALTATAALFLRVFSLQIPVYGIAVVLGGILQAHKRFFWPTFAPLVSSLVVIAVYASFGALAQGQQGNVSTLSQAAIDFLAWGTTLGVAFLALPLLAPVRSTGLRLRPSFRFPPGEGQRAASLAFAGIAALIAQQVSTFIIMRTANSVGGPGVWTVYLYIQQIYLLPYAVLAFPIATSAFPHFTAHSAAGRYNQLRALVQSTTRLLLLTTALGAAALMAAAPHIERVFSAIATGDGVAGLGTGLTFMAPGLLGLALILHASRILMATDHARSAMVATAAGWTLTSALVLALPLLDNFRSTSAGQLSRVTIMGYLGASVTLGMWCAGLLLLLAVHRHLGPGALTGLPRTCGILAVGLGLGAVLGRLISLPGLPGANGTAGAGTTDSGLPPVLPPSVPLPSVPLPPGQLSTGQMLVQALAWGALAALTAGLVVAAVALADGQLRQRLRRASKALARRVSRSGH